jgi:branched-chain amino acid aminotransferase
VAALLPQAEAAGRGFQQVLFLDARERLSLEETGATNVMFRAGNQLLTPSLGDTLLDGVTRRSIMALAPGRGFEVVARPLPWRETLADVAAGCISEAFGLGTRAGVLPFKCIGTAEQTLPLASDGASSQLRAALRAEQLGQEPQPWLDYVG